MVPAPALAILGGTFDPFHRGHREPVLAILKDFGWHRVIYMPACRQPFKSEWRSSSPYDRFAMAVLATAADDWNEVSSLELDRGAVSYAIDTLRDIAAGTPEATIDWIIGDDNLADLVRWREIDRIFELANFVVLTRGIGGVPPELEPRLRQVSDRGRCGSIVLARNTTIPVSATEIRARVRRGESIDALVDSRVARYIHKQRLYR
jgi:nicotinate-nucleotide adenylyltransferase